MRDKSGSFKYKTVEISFEQDAVKETAFVVGIEVVDREIGLVEGCRLLKSEFRRS